MANSERYIDADLLIKNLMGAYVPTPTFISNSYGNSSSLDYALNSVLINSVGPAITYAVECFKQQVIKAIEESATLKGTPCFLCKQRDCDELPEDIHSR